MIHIQSLELREVRLPLVTPFEISSGLTTERRILLLKLTDANGLSVWSECVAGEKPNYMPETIDSAWMIIRSFLAPLILNKSFGHPSEIDAVLNQMIKGNRMAKAALEMGAWAVYAHKTDQSLSKALGGTQSQVPTGISIGLQATPQELAQKVRESLVKGYHKIKIKIKPGKDIDFVTHVRKELGMTFPLMVDANNAYTVADLPLLKKLDAAKLMMIEQPLAWDDIYQHRLVQKELKTPVCLDESITTVQKAEEMAGLQSGRIINIKPGRVGGFSEAVRIHDYCEENGIPVWCGGMLESGIGRAYNVALASLPNFTLPGDISPSSRYWKEDLVAPAWEMDEKGYMSVPTHKPGLGITVKEDLINQLTVRKETLTKETSHV